MRHDEPNSNFLMFVSLIGLVDAANGDKCYFRSCVLFDKKEIILRMQFVFLSLISASMIITTGFDV